jgi:hypothetical protein
MNDDEVVDFLGYGWMPCALFAGLHTLDYLLTIAGARWYDRVPRVGPPEGSYELNPLFLKTVDRRQWWSQRFAQALRPHRVEP